MSISKGIDKVTGQQIRVDYPHHEIHEGNGYQITYSALKDAAELIEVRVLTNFGHPTAHVIVDAHAALGSTFELFEGTTKTHVGGNAIIPLNRNRNSTKTSALTMCHTPGGSESGTAIFTEYYGSANAGGQGGGTEGASQREEINLKHNTAYLFRVTSRANNNAITIHLDWYEHTSKAQGL